MMTTTRYLIIDKLNEVYLKIEAEADIRRELGEYFTFEVTNREIAELLNVQYQTTLLIFKDNKEIYRSVGETTKDLIYEAIRSSI